MYKRQASICVSGAAAGVCFADVSTGAMEAAQLSENTPDELEKTLLNELARFSPREILLNPEGLNLSELPDFMREKLSASVECLEERQFSLDACTEPVSYTHLSYHMGIIIPNSHVDVNPSNKKIPIFA